MDPHTLRSRLISLFGWGRISWYLRARVELVNCCFCVLAIALFTFTAYGIDGKVVGDDDGFTLPKGEYAGKLGTWYVRMKRQKVKLTQLQSLHL